MLAIAGAVLLALQFGTGIRLIVPGSIFATTAFATLPAITSVVVALWWATTTRTAPRLARVGLGVLALPLVPVAAGALLLLAFTGGLTTPYGARRDELRFQTLALGRGEELVAYQGNGGATTAFTLTVRHEQALMPGIRAARVLFSREHPSRAALALDSAGRVRITPDVGPAAVVPLRHLVVF